jgi:hypothetical protein
MRKIQDGVGSFWIFNYFLYLRWYHIEPIGIETFFNGLNCIPIFQELESKW